MSELQIGFVLFIATFLVLFSGIPIGFGLVLISIVFLLVFGDAGALSSVSSIFIGELSSFALLTIPLFVLLGCTIGASRAGKDLYEALHRWLVRVPGGLVIANILGCGLFAAMCGSSPATAAAIGSTTAARAAQTGRAEIYPRYAVVLRTIAEFSPRLAGDLIRRSGI